MKKKYLFLSLIAAMVMALGAKAQEETYNMIIKMADGTTVFINPHDVDSISFNNGEVSVSGSNIDQLVQTIATLKTDIDLVWANSNANLAEAKTYADIQICETKLDMLYAMANLRTELGDYATEEDLKAMDRRIDSIVTAILLDRSYYEHRITKNENDIEWLKKKFDYMNDKIDSLADGNYVTKDELDAWTETLKMLINAKFDLLDQYIENYRDALEALQTAVGNFTEADYNALEGRVTGIENELNGLLNHEDSTQSSTIHSE